MLRKVKKCPLIATTKDDKMILLEHDVTVKGTEILDLTVESIVEISIDLYKKGIDIVSVSIDEARMVYIDWLGRRI